MYVLMLCRQHVGLPRINSKLPSFEETLEDNGYEISRSVANVQTSAAEYCCSLQEKQ